jgi:hypothetical protein
MQTQQDYEVDVLLAVFPSPAVAEAAERALADADIASTEVPLAPGRYQLADFRLRRRARAVVGAAMVGGVVGAAVGAVVALLLFGTYPIVTVWLAIAGLLGGAIIGPLFGIERASRYDADVARSTDIAPDSSAVLVRAEASRVGAHGSVREIVEGAGAVALLDVPAYDARVRGAGATSVVLATSAGEPERHLPAA